MSQQTFLKQILQQHIKGDRLPSPLVERIAKQFIYGSKPPVENEPDRLQSPSKSDVTPSPTRSIPPEILKPRRR